MTNITLNAPIDGATTPPCPLAPPLGSVCFNTYDKAPDVYDIPLPLALAPGTGSMVRFDVCATSTLQPGVCVSAHPGTVYAFTIVTGRGNQFVAYEKR